MEGSILGPNVTKIAVLGKGTSGVCALVRKNDENNKLYVVKTVDLSKLNKKERTQSLNEARILSLLRNPGVIAYYDSYLSKKSDHLCIVMEYADGKDMSHKVKSAQGVNFSEDQVLDWMIQGALALNHVHSRHVLHRDIKTQNIFLTSDGLCKLGDFGIARTLTGAGDQAKTFVGTPYYLSPELILEKPYDFMSDVWSFGVCLYEMMALKHPFNAGDMKGLMQKILRVQYDPLPTCYSPELRSIVSRLLVKNPSERLKLSELLQQPIVINRMQKWMKGNILPARYIAALVRFKLLPSAVEPPAHLVQQTLPMIGNAAQPINRRDSEASLPSFSSVGGTPANTNGMQAQLPRVAGCGGGGGGGGGGGAQTARPAMPPPPPIMNSNNNHGKALGNLSSVPSGSFNLAAGFNAPPTGFALPSGFALPLAPATARAGGVPSLPSLPPLPGGGLLNMKPAVPAAPNNNNNSAQAGVPRRSSFHFPPPPPPPPSKSASALPSLPPPQFINAHPPQASAAQSARLPSLPALPAIGGK